MTPRAILTDIEGTTSSIAFVHEVLFSLFAGTAGRLCRRPSRRGGADPRSGARRGRGRGAGRDAMRGAAASSWHDADRKIEPLKALQGLIWAQGYAEGALQGHVYADAVMGLRRWHAQGVALYVYSSGSVAAQRLIFGHTEFGDLTPAFLGPFDTGIGRQEGGRFLSRHRARHRSAGGGDSLPLRCRRGAGGGAGRGPSGAACWRATACRPICTGRPWSISRLSSRGKPASCRRRPSHELCRADRSELDHLAGIPAVAARLDGGPADWQAREVGDGNLNLVFLVTGPEGGVAAKQALPYVRLVGESWPLPLSRAYYERLALADQARWSPARVPALIHHDDDMALTVMELLRPHRTLRGALVEGARYPLLAGHHCGIPCRHFVRQQRHGHARGREESADRCLSRQHRHVQDHRGSDLRRALFRGADELAHGRARPRRRGLPGRCARCALPRRR